MVTTKFHIKLYQIIKRSFVVVFVFLYVISNAQRYNFKNYSIENGLPFIQIFALHQDSKGYLWSGGYGGLSKFNGKVFQNFSPKNGLANHYVNAICEDKNGVVFIGTIDGLTVINNQSITNYGKAQGLLNTHITSLTSDFSGKIWIGTKRGLYTYENGKISEHQMFSSISINCLLYTKQQGLILGTNQGLFIDSENSHKLITITDGLPTNEITCLSSNNQATELYIGTSNGLCKYNFVDDKYFNFHINNGLLDEVITSIACSAEGEIWIGSKTGLISFLNETFNYYTIKQDNNSNHITSLMFDYEHNLWIGTHNGLFKYRGKGFSIYGKDEGLGGAFVYQIIADSEKNIWATTEHNGAFKYEQGVFKNYSEKNGLPDNQAQCALAFNDGTVWIGTQEGIARIKNGKTENINDLLSLSIKVPIYCLYQDAKNNIWFGTKNGLGKIYYLNNKYWVSYFKLPTEVVNYEVWSIIEDVNKTLWVGTYLGGLYKLQNNEFVNEPIKTSQKIESVLDICFDNKGIMYAATLNGVLVHYTQKKFSKLITEKEGLSSDLVYSLKITRNNKYVWAGTNQGINRLDVDKLSNGIIDILSYNKDDGFEGIECNTHGIFEDEKSNLWFGTVNGLIKYTPSEFKENDNPSKTHITHFKLGYIDTLLSNEVRLSYYENNISFYFDGISLTNPDKVLYSYKLEGFDKSWSPNSNFNFAKYDNLPAGKYTFKVKSCNSDGIWNIEPIEFKFEIKAAFYKTWWFITLLIVTSIGLIAFVFLLRLKQVSKKQQEKFEQQVEVSKAELKALRAQMNPHFVFNSLNSIQHYILNNKGDEAAKYLNKFAKLIRLILNNSDKPTVTINEDIESLKLYLELERMRFENKFDYEITISNDLDGDYDEIPPMLIQPYIENSILHGINPKEGNGHIKINITSQNQYIKISVIDDGIGREKSKAIQTIKPNNKHKSLAMKITKDRLRILNSMHDSVLNVKVSDVLDEHKNCIGTQVDLYIPYLK